MARHSKKAWVVDVSMGYGHQRAAYPLRAMAKGNKILHADSYPGIPQSDKKVWETTRSLYETVSRLRKLPVLGDFLFSMFDKFQEIAEFYPKTQGIEPPTLQLKQIYGLLEKKSWGMHLIEKLNKNPLPLVTTFFAVAFMAEYWEYRGPVWLVVTDTDVSRAWAPLEPQKTSIRYLAPTSLAKERLLRYGIPSKNIFFTGFPLPPELLEHSKEDLKRRLQVLDPQGVYKKRYAALMKKYVGAVSLASPRKRSVPVVTFAVGGAGAQAEIGEQALRSLAPLLREKKVILNLVAGTHKDVALQFLQAAKETGVSAKIGDSLNVLHQDSLGEYLKAFPKVLRKTDILWTKPSELVFYAALGIPLLLAPPLGSQERRNQEWVLFTGAGMRQLDPRFTNEWLLDFVQKGSFAEAAMQGFVEMERKGAQSVAKLVA